MCTNSHIVHLPSSERTNREEVEVEQNTWAGAAPRKPSPYLSNRGNVIRDFTGILREAFLLYHKDKHDEKDNPNGMINLGTSENKLCTDLLSERLSQADMFHIEPHLLQYADWKGRNFLREEVARFLNDYCKAPRPLKADNVVTLNGCTSVFCCLSAVLCDPEDAVLVPTPFYGMIKKHFILYNNVKLVYAHLTSEVSAADENPFHLSAEKLEKALQKATQEGARVKAIILINPHNPLGDVYTSTEMMQFLEFAKRHELHAIVDEIYMLSVFDECTTFQSVLSFKKLPDPQRTHVMWGISKDFVASGMRVSCLYTENQDVISAIGELASFHGVPGPTQYQVAQLLRDRDWIDQVYLKAHRNRLREAHLYVVNELTNLQVPFLHRPAGFFVWVDFRKFLKEETFEEEINLWRHFLHEKILICCGKAFDCCEPGWFRIVFSDKLPRLQLGLQRLQKALQQLEENRQYIDP
ncbi:1-aminocyclopropane-1-carboxylate synthase-like protein 1 isoform X1 [Polypterus senegalus]|uniref:1-aminocyclopropane-1-carboxylate synthase-like protein 1 isoform X1 n=1 Tax=Polypterus senegalus TaxID=55291 RepID=UPI001963551F|nr:1-aminocyclopropane-1-carboxylate synthase-like protein 1 isoform X1 [Polypterus senegalus]XP_039600096.1 1-aminocyclopropane-1-carboxylate synthase-like protein 1 isoform X1 [Polypterus senegalus]